jgi:predicted Fe-Mo cluster-binding NifX family protein
MTTTTTTTTPLPKETTIRIAIPVADGRMHGHFGGCREFALVDADMQNRVVLATQIIPAPPHKPGLYPRWLREQGVRVVIAGGMGKGCLNNLLVNGVLVLAGEVNARVEVLVAAYLAGQLTGTPEGCKNHGHQHDHEHGHHHHHEHDHGHEGCDHGAATAH